VYRAAAAAALARLDGRQLLAGGAGAQVRRWKQAAASRVGVLAGLAQGGLGRGDRWTVRQCGVYPAGQLGVVERRPPACGHIVALQKALRVAVGGFGGGGGGWQRLRRVAIHRRRVRPAVIGADGATGDGQTGQQREDERGTGKRGGLRVGQETGQGSDLGEGGRRRRQ
jgi:hypothetical protein